MPAGLPQPDHGVVILLAMMGVRREEKGASWCRKKGIGAAREALQKGRIVTKNVLPMTPLGSRSLEQTMAEAETVLATNCRVCGRCEMSKR